MTATTQPAAGASLAPVLVVLSAGNFVIGMGAFVIIGVLGPLADDLSLSSGRAGWLITSYAVSYAIFSPLLVSATGRVGRRRVMAGALAVFAVANAACALAPSELPLHLSRIVAAAGAGCFTPVTSAVAARLAPPERRAQALAAVLFGITLAQVAGVPAGSWIAYTFGWRAAVWIVAALSVPAAVAIWVIVPAGLSFTPVSPRDLGRVLGSARTMLAVMFTTTFLGAIFVVYSYLGPLLERQMGYGRNGISAVLVVYGVGAVAGNLAGGWVADRIGPMATLLMLTGIQALTMPLFALLPLADAALVALVVFWSLVGWSFGAAQQVRLISLAPDSASVVLALNAAAIYVGAAVGSAIGGGVLDAFGPAALGVTGGIGALVALGHLALSRRMSGR